MKKRDVQLGEKIAAAVAKQSPLLLDHEEWFFQACFDNEANEPAARGADPSSLCEGYLRGYRAALCCGDVNVN